MISQIYTKRHGTQETQNLQTCIFVLDVTAHIYTMTKKWYVRDVKNTAILTCADQKGSVQSHKAPMSNWKPNAHAADRSVPTGSQPRPSINRTDRQTRRQSKNSAFNFFSKNPTNRSRRKDVKMILVNNHWCRIQKLYGASPDGFRERLQPDTAPVFIVRVLLNEQRFALQMRRASVS